MKEGFQPQRVASLLLISAICVIFILQFGPGSRGCDAPLMKVSNDAAAVVNGNEIPMRDFQRIYANQLNYFRGQKGMELVVANMVLRQMIQTELLAQAADKHGIAASDAELRKIIHQDPNFQKDGKFDYETYENITRDYLKKSPPQYEAELRRQLTASKMLDLAGNGATVSDDEVKARFFKEGDKAKATYVRFLPSMFVDQVAAPKPDEVKAFAASHEKEIADYYKDNQFLYHQPERVKARHILVKVDKDAPADEQKAAKEKADKIRAEIVAGKDFAAAAKEYSDDPGSKNQGGELGFNEKNAWVKEFSDAAFGQKEGEISQPVQSQFGFHLIQTEAKKPAEDKKLEDVKTEIAEQLLKKQKAQALAEAQAKDALAKAKAGKSLAELFPPKKDEGGTMRFEQEDKPVSVDTGDFSPSGDTVPQLGPAPELSKAIFSSKEKGLLDGVYKQGDGFVVAQVTSRELPSEATFASQKEKLREEALKAKQAELRESFVKSLHDQAKIVTNEQAIGQLAQQRG